MVTLIDQVDFIERILRHLGLQEAGVWVESTGDPLEPDEPIIVPGLEDRFPDYDQEQVFVQN